MIRLSCDRPGQISFDASLGRKEGAVRSGRKNGLILSGQADPGKPTAGVQFVGALRPCRKGPGSWLRRPAPGRIRQCRHAPGGSRDGLPPPYWEKKPAHRWNGPPASIRGAARRPPCRPSPALPAGRTEPGRPRRSPSPLTGELRGCSPVRPLGLVELYFQFGRYLLLGSSRPGPIGQPAGPLERGINPPWFCGYHLISTCR